MDRFNSQNDSTLALGIPIDRSYWILALIVQAADYAILESMDRLTAPASARPRNWRQDGGGKCWRGVCDWCRGQMGSHTDPRGGGKEIILEI